MKKTSLTLLGAIFALFTTGLSAQSTAITLDIEHLMGQDPLTNTVVGYNNLGNQFKLYRLEYYIDQIVIEHANGSSDSVSSTFLVNAFAPATMNLGSYNVDSIQGIRFAIGVRQSLNHLDPATYPPQHPLAPKNPSMHWGWSAGYRFLAAEGNSGPNLSQIFEFHGLGNSNYAYITVDTEGNWNSTMDTLAVKLVADYSMLTKGINLVSGPISHGEQGEAATALYNINNYVFTSSDGNAAIGLEEQAFFDVYPNPSNGQFTLSLDRPAEVRIIDMVGRTRISGRFVPGKHPIVLEDSGMYLIQIMQGSSNTTQKLYVR